MSNGTVEFKAGTPIIVGVSQAMQEVLRLADSVAPCDCPVLIEGESGTGKELVARRIWAKSRRNTHPFLPVNCAGISESLFESQFFGHVRGAFTGAEQDMLGVIRTANGGTLFLDEVSEIPLHLQPKFLRVLQEREVMPVGKPIPIKVDTRFIAGTNRNLGELVRQGHFRADLFYRLNIVRIYIPPLRQRSEDVPVLLDYLSRQFAAYYQRDVIPISAEVRAVLTGYAWPGNVRELAAWTERLYVTGLPPEVLVEKLFHDSATAAPQITGQPLTLREAERSAIVQALEQTNFNQRKAARLLQVHRATLARKLKRHKLA